MEPTSGLQNDSQSEKLEKAMDRSDSHGHGTVVSMTAIQSDVASNLKTVEEIIETIGFGNFQWQLTFSCGFGFLVDQMMLVSVGLYGPQASYEFGPRYPTLLSAALYAGLLVGAIVLGAVADNIGRRLVWQVSLFGSAVFTLLVASSPNWAALNVFVMFIGLFGGGNLAIDLTILAESIPRKWSFVMTGLAAIWGFGNAITGLIAWPLLVDFGCPGGSTPETCSKGENMGWRYLAITLGGLCFVMAAIRAFVLSSLESPRWLICCGRVEEAADVLNRISRINKSSFTVNVDQFIPLAQQQIQVRSPTENIRRVRALFSGPKQIRLMLCLVGLWAMVGIAYPLYTIFLPYYLAAHGANFGEQSNYITYRDWAVSSVVGIVGPFLSMFMVAHRWFKSRISLLIMGVICAAFSAAFTTVKTEGQNLAFSSMINFWLNALYAIIYSYTPQVLHVEYRGLGGGLLMAVGRTASLSAPFIATFADVTTSAPIWVSCACYIIIGILAVALPLDTASLW